jgi:amino acid transporter
VPKATLAAVTLIALFFRADIMGVCAADIVATAAKDPGLFIYTIAEKVLGGWATDLMSVLLITSLFAATQAFYNTLSRYLFAISRDGLLWSKMAYIHPSFQTPYIASMVQGIFMFCATAFETGPNDRCVLLGFRTGQHGYFVTAMRRLNRGGRLFPEK